MKLDFEKMGGLIPAIVQDNNTNKVLMLGFMNVDLVVDVAAVLETYQVAENAQLHVAALAAVLYEDGGRTAVYLRGAGQVVIGHAEADEHRQGEPVPVGQNHL